MTVEQFLASQTDAAVHQLESLIESGPNGKSVEQIIAPLVRQTFTLAYQAVQIDIAEQELDRIRSAVLSSIQFA